MYAKIYPYFKYLIFFPYQMYKKSTYQVFYEVYENLINITNELYFECLSMFIYTIHFINVTTICKLY